MFPRQPEQTHLGNVEMQSPPKPQRSYTYAANMSGFALAPHNSECISLSLPGTAAVDLIGLRLDSHGAAREDGGSRRVGIGPVERWRS